jgi:preprotein translocase subunit SecA
MAYGQVNEARKIGRNEPCYCGSGKKYKKCCGAIKPN